MPTLDWLNRAEAFSTAARVPYRLLEPQSAHGDGDPRNLLIQGDNLEALKALLPFYRGQVNGRWNFKKHYYAEIGKLRSSGEEFDCAVALDRTPEVRHWVRNLEQQPRFAFWLPTATDYFYPDFVAELDDGRVLVVEYNGEGFATNDDSREKKLVGARWAQQTGQCFAMVEKRLNGQDMAAQIRAALR